MKSFKNINLIALCSIFIISSCSSMDGLRFWKSDEIDPDEPKELVAFSNQKNIVIEWKNSFKGENEIGNFLLNINPMSNDNNYTLSYNPKLVAQGEIIKGYKNPYQGKSS